MTCTLFFCGEMKYLRWQLQSVKFNLTLLWTQSPKEKRPVDNFSWNHPEAINQSSRTTEKTPANEFRSNINLVSKQFPKKLQSNSCSKVQIGTKSWRCRNTEHSEQNMHKNGHAWTTNEPWNWSRTINMIFKKRGRFLPEEECVMDETTIVISVIMSLIDPISFVCNFQLIYSFLAFGSTKASSCVC